MKRWFALALVVCGGMLLIPASWPALAQATDTPTPTATNTATATSTITATPAIVITGVTSNNQSFVVERYINAGDIALVIGWLIALGLMIFFILLETKETR